jgi:hypothetical protein
MAENWRSRSARRHRFRICAWQTRSYLNGREVDVWQIADRKRRYSIKPKRTIPHTSVVVIGRRIRVLTWPTSLFVSSARILGRLEARRRFSETVFVDPSTVAPGTSRADHRSPPSPGLRPSSIVHLFVGSSCLTLRTSTVMSGLTA